MNSSRRALLRGGASALALAAAHPRRAVAANGLLEQTVAGGAPFKVLEIFFAGALSHRETWWVEQPDEDPIVRSLDALAPTDPILSPSGAPTSWTGALPALLAYKGTDYRVGTAGGRDIHLGPCAAPLVGSGGAASLLGRMRVIATGHGASVHEIAQALMQQGLPSSTSQTRAAGVGAAIARHSGLPSFVFYDSRLSDSTNAAIEAAKTGRHGNHNAPIRIPYDNPALIGQLAVPRVPARDALVGLYRDRYDAGLTFAATGSPASGLRARSEGFDRYVDALEVAFGGPQIAGLLQNLPSSNPETLWDNPVRRAIQTSVALLGAGESRYCCVSDGGLVGDDFGGFSHYDSHLVASFSDHAAFVTANVLNVLRTLREEIDQQNLDLSDTLVVLNTEYGRSFSEPNGSEHCWEGFAVAMLGGPIANGGVVGDLPFTPNDDALPRERGNPAFATGAAYGSGPVTPTDLRAAVLLAAGIRPFQPGVFERHEARTDPALSEEAAADQLATHIFGA